MKQKRLFLLNKSNDEIFYELLCVEQFSIAIDTSVFIKNEEPDYVLSKVVYSKNMTKASHGVIKVKPEDIDGRKNIINVVFNITDKSIKEAMVLI